jgi:formylglycine-generating enzyme required for sulfatase activity
MSRAGKFIPGGGSGGKAPPAGRTGPIRAPDPSAPPEPSAGGAAKPFSKQSLVKQKVTKSQRMPIAIMSAITCIVLVSVAWYTLAYSPMKRSLAAAQQAINEAQKQLNEERRQEELEKQKALDSQKEVRGTLTLDSNPTGAEVTLGDFRKTTPASFSDIVPGTVSIVIHLDGYEDYKTDATVGGDHPTDLGTIPLVQKTGNLSITSPQTNVTYTLTGPGGYSHGGQVPDKIAALAIGDYMLTASQGDWQLPSVPITVKDHDNLTRDIKFPYASVSLTSAPSGATVRDGRTVLGVTPLTLSQIRPRDLHVSLDLPPYAVQRVEIHVPDFGNVIKQVTLHQDKDFVAACGMPMVWVADGGFWAGKYLVRQSDLETVGANDPSTFRRPTRPVETISWEAAMAFCEQLNQFEKKAGKLPEGYHYSLPKEAQWETFSADANIDLAATSRVSTLSATQDVGYSEPNKFGIYDSIGNVWEWMLDNYDANGNHSLRGGCWLSSTEHFPSAEVRQAGGPKYADQFTGFRVVLVPN